MVALERFQRVEQVIPRRQHPSSPLSGGKSTVFNKNFERCQLELVLYPNSWKGRKSTHELGWEMVNGSCSQLASEVLLNPLTARVAPEQFQQLTFQGYPGFPERAGSGFRRTGEDLSRNSREAPRANQVSSGLR